MRTLMLILALSGCSAFDPPEMHAGETRCIVGDCKSAAIQQSMHDVKDPAFNASVESAKDWKNR